MLCSPCVLLSRARRRQAAFRAALQTQLGCANQIIKASFNPSPRKFKCEEWNVTRLPRATGMRINANICESYSESFTAFSSICRAFEMAWKSGEVPENLSRSVNRTPSIGGAVPSEKKKMYSFFLPFFLERNSSCPS